MTNAEYNQRAKTKVSLWKRSRYSLALTAALLASSTTYSYGGTIQGKTILLPAGTHFEGRIDGTISSRKSHQGDAFNLEMSSPVLVNGTETVIPSGSQIVGEVVEAIPSSKQPHKKKTPKPIGKLRVQLTGLRLPDGTAYPLVASLASENLEGRGPNGHGKANSALGGGVGYVGAESAFDRTPVGSSKKGGVGRNPQIDFNRDPIFGHHGNPNAGSTAGRIRSLILQKNDLYIMSGSPVSVRLDAPLKMAINATITPGADTHVPQSSGFKRFNKGGGNNAGDPQQSEQTFFNPEPAPSSGPFTPGSLPFLQPQNQTPPQGQVPPGAQAAPAKGGEFPPLPKPAGSGDF